MFAHFVAYLQREYGSVARLNEVWGLTYWSQRLASWEELWPPDDNTNQGYDLAWRRFQAELVTDFLTWQAHIVREYIRPGQFITHDFVGGDGKGESHRYAVAKVLDVSAENPYHPTQDGLLLPPQPGPLPTVPWMHDPVSGPWWLARNADFGWGAKETNFLVTELNTQNISMQNPSWAFPPYDGQWRLAAYMNILRGANSILYWHWHTTHYGNEAHLAGILSHDLEPNRCYAEIQQLGQELRQNGDILTDVRPDAEVAFLYSYDSRYALEFQPCLTLPDTQTPDLGSYQRIFDALYRGFFAARAQAAILPPEAHWERYPILVVPALYSADDALLARLVKYAEDGGHLVLTMRSGFADEDARIRWQRAPGPLRASVGASYQEYSALLQPLSLHSDPAAAALSFALPPAAQGESWVDGLLLEGATPLAWYDHPHFGRFPAVTTQVYGRGRVTYVGTLPNDALAGALAEWVCRQGGIAQPGAGWPVAVRLNTARTPTGQQLHLVTNWSWEAQRIATPAASALNLVTQQSVGAEVELGAWDLALLLAPR